MIRTLCEYFGIQVVHAEVRESTTNRTAAPCSFLVDKNAELELPAEVHFHGVDSEIHGLWRDETSHI